MSKRAYRYRSPMLDRCPQPRRRDPSSGWVVIGVALVFGAVGLFYLFAGIATAIGWEP